MRKNLPVMTDGEYVRLDEGHPEIYAYARMNKEQTLVVISNFSDHGVSFELPEEMHDHLTESRSVQLLIGNTTEEPKLTPTVALRPYASYMWLIHNN